MPHRLAHHSDEELLDLVRAGRTEAADQLWRRHYPAVLAAARATSRGYDPEDLTSEAFFAMLQALRGGTGPKHSIRAYLNTAVRRAAAENRRETALDEPETLESLVPPALGPDARVPRHAMIRDTFAELPPRWRQVLMRSIVYGDTNAEIAQDMGLTTNAVAALATRARQGWRRRYLQKFAAVDVPTRKECIDVVPQMIDMLAQATVRAAPEEIVRHLQECAECTARLTALQRARQVLAGTAHPALLGTDESDLRRDP